MFTDAANCGACGLVCGSNTIGCANGQCQCGEVYEKICNEGKSCIDVRSSVSHCGDCHIQCHEDTLGCAEGWCQCKAGYGAVQISTNNPDHENENGYTFGCQNCKDVIGYSNGGTFCMPCASHCLACDAETGECITNQDGNDPDNDNDDTSSNSNDDSSSSSSNDNDNENTSTDLDTTLNGDSRLWHSQGATRCGVLIQANNQAEGERICGMNQHGFEISVDCMSIEDEDTMEGMYHVYAKFRILLRCGTQRVLGDWQAVLSAYWNQNVMSKYESRQDHDSDSSFSSSSSDSDSSSSSSSSSSSNDMELMFIHSDGSMISGCTSCPGLCDGSSGFCKEGVYILRQMVSEDDEDGLSSDGHQIQNLFSLYFQFIFTFFSFFLYQYFF